ncbi:cbb3-type cytochrome oxidase assembly protein CcoS [Aquamicrobium zhengzhouense]|uniref:cbb3-type cytochrome oxidase assembly protein CcoS n=1 Tax=Aquamicrobium zhengzhouense TaxID=2781738 RepID=UPI002D7EA8B8|nr:cbb3-type cytochrome oxidase assembly protein CcoS [Aquamicrobium zhengzhouense]
MPIALGMGLVGLAAFLWSMGAGQYEDLDGAAERVLIPDAKDAPLPWEAWTHSLARNVPSGMGKSPRGPRGPPRVT